MTVAEARLYPPALYSALHEIAGRHVLTWRRRILCPQPGCLEARVAAKGRHRRRELGRQYIRVSADPRDWSKVTGFRVERIELGRELIALPSLPNGTLHFGVPQAIRRMLPTPATPAESPLHRAVPVLSSVRVQAPQVGRHSRHRLRGGPGAYRSLALSEDEAGQPFVVTCPDCRVRCLIDGALPEAELRQLTSVAQEALRG